jgi:hypothetical protein
MGRIPFSACTMRPEKMFRGYFFSGNAKAT